MRFWYFSDCPAAEAKTSMIRKYHNYKPQSNPWHREEEPHNHHKTPGAVSGEHFTQGTILIVILVSSGSAKSRTHQSAVGGFLVTRRGWTGRLRAYRIWTFINSV